MKSLQLRSNSTTNHHTAWHKTFTQLSTHSRLHQTAQPQSTANAAVRSSDVKEQTFTKGKVIVITCTVMRKGKELNRSIGSKSLHPFVQRLLVPSVRQQVAKPQVLMTSQQNCHVEQFTCGTALKKNDVKEETFRRQLKTFLFNCLDS